LEIGIASIRTSVTWSEKMVNVAQLEGEQTVHSWLNIAE
jgi:hypothetical protein